MNLLKGINREIAAFGLLIISIGLQIMDLQVVIVNNIAGAIIGVIGILVLLSAREKTISKI
jgi:hypothetical protein